MSLYGLDSDIVKNMKSNDELYYFYYSGYHYYKDKTSSCICDICKKPNGKGRICTKCEKWACHNCIVITGYYIQVGLCEHCYSYKCQLCEKDLSRDRHYLIDKRGSLPRCAICRHLDDYF